MKQGSGSSVDDEHRRENPKTAPYPIICRHHSSCPPLLCRKSIKKQRRVSWTYYLLFAALLTSLPQGGRCESASKRRIEHTIPRLNDGSAIRKLQTKRSPILKRLRSWLKGASIQLGPVGKQKSSPEKPDSFDSYRDDLVKIQTALPSVARALEEALGDNNDDSEECEEEETFSQDDTKIYGNEVAQPKQSVPILGGAIHSLLSNQHRLVQFTGKAAQFCVVWYLVTVVWKALGEALEELTGETGGSREPYFCSRAELPRLLLFLEREDPAPPTNLPRSIVELAQNLRAAGLPIYSPHSQRSSIESLFLELTRTEASILQQCLWKPPPSVQEQPGLIWDSVLGLQDVQERLLLTVTSSSPHAHDGSQKTNLVRETQEAYSSLLHGSEASSTSQHHGVLLFGEPGCGKSFLVQALAARLQWPCLVVTPSVLMRKYVGDTNLQVRTLFSLIQHKLSPCIVVLDELDGLFRERHDLEHDSSRELKTEFLQWMSGIMASSSNEHRHPPIIIGATNRPSDVDSAILRRLPQRFYIGPPNYATRCQIFQRMLKDVPLAEDFDINWLSSRTEGYTPSDIQQVLRTAVRGGPLKEALLFEQWNRKQETRDAQNTTVRPLTTQDVLGALAHVHQTPLSPSYRQALQKFARLNDGDEWEAGPEYPHPNPVGIHFADMGTVQAPFPSSSPPDPQNFGDTEYEESTDDHDDGDFYDEDDDEEFDL